MTCKNCNGKGWNYRTPLAPGGGALVGPPIKAPCIDCRGAWGMKWLSDEEINACQRIQTLSVHDARFLRVLKQAHEANRLRSVLIEIECFGHSRGHGRGYTCANMAAEALATHEREEG